MFGSKSRIETVSDRLVVVPCRHGIWHVQMASEKARFFTRKIKHQSSRELIKNLFLQTSPVDHSWEESVYVGAGFSVGSEELTAWPG